MTEQNILISELNLKVERLIKSYVTLQEQKRDMDAEVLRLQRQKQDLTSEKQQLEKEIKTLKAANAISAGKGTPEARAQIGQLVREIDKCINLLNN